MSVQKFNRRRFLLLAGGLLGGGALAGAGWAVADPGAEDTPPLPAMSDVTYGETNMNPRILVTYASQAGSTAGVAEAIGQALATNGAMVDVRPMTAVSDLSPYQAVILGSAIHSGKWLPEARAFIDRHASTLRRIPNAIFQVCMMMATDSESNRQMSAGWLEPVREQLRSVAVGSFSGALWPGQYPSFSDKLGLRIFLAVIKLKAGDYRNWDAIRTWATGLSPLLAP